MLIQISDTLYVNTEQIESIGSFGRKDTTIVSLVGGSDNYFEVDTPIEKIIAAYSSCDEVVLLN